MDKEEQITFLKSSTCGFVSAIFMQLIADSGTPAAPLRSRQRPHCSEIKHSTWRQEFLGRGSEN